MTDELDGMRGAHFVQSLERGLAVIRAFGADTPSLTLSEVARATGLTRAGARRFLLTLTDLGYVRTDGRRFELTARVLELGYAFLSSISLPEVAEPHLERLVAEVHESSSVSVLDGDDIVYVARSSSSTRIMSIDLAIGSRLPAFCTSMGRVLLAGLTSAELSDYLKRLRATPFTPRTLVTKDKLREAIEAVRDAGFSLVDQELEVGLRSIAVPVIDARRRVAAAVNISAQAPRVSVGDLEKRCLPPLRAAASELALLLG